MANFNDSKITKPKPMKPKTNKSKSIPPGVNAFIDTPGGCKYVFKDAIEDIFDGFEVDANFVEASRSAVMFGTSSVVPIPSAPTVGFRGGKASVYHSETVDVSSPGWSTKNVVSVYAKPCNNIGVSEFHN